MEAREATTDMEVDDTTADNQATPAIKPDTTEDSITTTEKPSQDRKEKQPQKQGLSEDLIALREEKKRTMMNLISKVHDTFNGLDRYSMQLTKMKEEHLQHLMQLQDMEAYNKEMLRRLQAEHDRLLELQVELGGQQDQRRGEGGGDGGNNQQA